MPETHFQRHVLQGFLQGKLGADENRRVVKHLLQGCLACRGVTEELWKIGSTSDSSAACTAPTSPEFGQKMTTCFKTALLKAERRQAELNAERQEAVGLLGQLEACSVRRRWALVAQSRRFGTWGLVERLLDKCWSYRFDDAKMTLEFAQLAVVVAERLDPGYYGTELVPDLKARAWSYLANAHKIRSDYHTAESGFEIAERWLKQGTGDPIEKAQTLRLKAALRCAQERLDEARTLLDRVIAIYRRADDPHAMGTILAQKGMVCGYMGDRGAAIALLRQSLDLLDRECEPVLFLTTRHNLVFLLYEYGELDEALSLLRQIRPLYDQKCDRLNLLRLRWLEGKIAKSQGQIIPAEAALLEARNGFLAQEILYDAAEVSLELATIYAAQGRSAEMKELAEEILPVFESKDMRCGVMAALLVFRQAAEKEAVSQELIEELLGSLDRARHQNEAAACRPACG